MRVVGVFLTVCKLAITSPMFTAKMPYVLLLLGDLSPQCLRSFGPGPHWGTSFPRHFILDSGHPSRKTCPCPGCLYSESVKRKFVRSSDGSPLPFFAGTFSDCARCRYSGVRRFIRTVYDRISLNLTCSWRTAWHSGRNRSIADILLTYSSRTSCQIRRRWAIAKTSNDPEHPTKLNPNFSFVTEILKISRICCNAFRF